MGKRDPLVVKDLKCWCKRGSHQQGLGKETNLLKVTTKKVD